MVEVGRGYEQYSYSADYGTGLFAFSCLRHSSTGVPYLGILAEILGKETGDSIMEIATFFGMFLGYFISAIPALVFCTAVIILVKVRLRHGGGRAARFLVVGAEPEKLPELPVAETTTETCQRVSKYRRCQRELEDSR